MNNILNFFTYMEEAIVEAQKAYVANEWPIGVVVVYQDIIIARAHNTVEMTENPCAHAEILAINLAREYMLLHHQEKFLHDCTLFVTLEPCKMCLEYMRTARIGKIIYGSSATTIDTYELKIIDGIYEQECNDMMKNFAKQMRTKEII